MKIFLSHSSADKWLARRIASDLSTIGAQTFLDEKDIATGESIDSAIQEHLADCSDFLILLSPASIKSDWVLVELGGALALNKKVIPIFLYLGANDMPKPISKLKGRDIADIEKYYDELRAKVPNLPQSGSPVVLPVRRRRLKSNKGALYAKGDFVILPKEFPSPAFRENGQISFSENMERYCGLVTKVSGVNRRMRWVRVDVDGGKWAWAYEWITKKES